MTRIGSNSLGYNGHLRRFEASNRQVAQSLERLSTGKRINRPSDDPAGFVLAEDLRSNLDDLRRESRVAKAERFRVRQNESALSQIQNELNKVRGNLVTASDGLISPSQQQALQLEIDASLDAIDQIAEHTEGVAGAEALRNLRQGGSANVINGDVQAATDLVDDKANQISRARAAAGAYERAQLDTFERLREDQAVITAEALSQVEDANFAAESANLVQGQILAEASIAALAFATREQIELFEELLEGLDIEA